MCCNLETNYSRKPQNRSKNREQNNKINEKQKTNAVTDLLCLKEKLICFYYSKRLQIDHIYSKDYKFYKETRITEFGWGMNEKSLTHQVLCKSPSYTDVSGNFPRNNQAITTFDHISRVFATWSLNWCRSTKRSRNTLSISFWSQK